MEKNIRLDKWRRLSAIDEPSKTVFSVRKPSEKKRHRPEAKTRRSHQKSQENHEAQMASLGQRLQAIRRANNITQAKLAKMAGVTDRQVRNWEDGTSDPHGRLPEIAAALGVTEIDILDIDGPIPPPRNHRGG
jgi:DNA-binding transcriptional regulator YiaG